MKVLIIGDNYQSTNKISLYLKALYSDIVVVTAESSADVTELLKQVAPSLIILDSAVSSEGITDLIERIRRLSDAFLLVLNEEHSDIEHAMWPETEPDEVVSKHYSSTEFLARCVALALLLRTKGYDPAQTSVSFDGMTIRFDTREVFICGQRVHLTPIEFALLSVLAKNMGHIVPGSDLLEKVWGIGYQGDFNLLKTYIYRLRNKLRPLGDRDQVITNERGFGYRCGIN